MSDDPNNFVAMNTLRLDTACVRDSSGTQREFLDYFVDGLRFPAWLGLMTGEPERWQNYIFATPFRHDISKTRRTGFYRMLAGKRPGDLSGSRVPLYVCSCCADYGCGVASVELRICGGVVEWSAFAPFTVDGVLSDVPTLRFEKVAYESALSVALAVGGGQLRESSCPGIRLLRLMGSTRPVRRLLFQIASAFSAAFAWREPEFPLRSNPITIDEFIYVLVAG